jgi:hypothetical protein
MAAMKRPALLLPIAAAPAQELNRPIDVLQVDLERKHPERVR